MWLINELRENRRLWCSHKAQKGMEEVASDGCPKGMECKLSTARKAEGVNERVLINCNSKCKNKLSTDVSRRVSVRLAYTSVVKVGDQWLICHTHQEKQCQHVQIEKVALALVHKCKISHLYLCVANVSWTDHKTLPALPKGTWWSLMLYSTHISFLGTR